MLVRNLSIEQEFKGIAEAAVMRAKKIVPAPIQIL